MSSFRLPATNQPAAFPLVECQDNAEQLCQGGRDGSEGERQPSTPCFLEPATACVSSLEGFLQGKREVIQALAHGTSV